VLSDTVKALGRRVRVSHDYDIPYIAAYSADGRTVFIDRHLPRTFRSWTQTIRVAQFLLVHEIIEKALLDELRLHYLHAHQIAVRAERDAVRLGVPSSARRPLSHRGASVPLLQTPFPPPRTHVASSRQSAWRSTRSHGHAPHQNKASTLAAAPLLLIRKVASAADAQGFAPDPRGRGAICGQ
jgi:hypothetical protein